jgi:ATP/ADP translocase
MSESSTQSDKPNRVYIAAKMGKMEHIVSKLRGALEEKGYVILYDWTEHPVEMPFDDHLDEAHEASEKMAQAVRQCDVFIVFDDPAGKGLHVEAGGALFASIVLSFLMGQQRKNIFAINQTGKFSSIFYYNHRVSRVSTADAVLKALPSMR